jgi:aerobic carbon-monoxide dehydrogenase medium subunit
MIRGVVKPPPFEYHRPATRADVDRLLAEHGPEAKILAGGQSLIPILNMRLAAPAHVIDINALEDEPSEPHFDDGVVRFGPLVRQSAVERWPELANRAPALKEAIAYTAHPAIRSRGTLVGSIAHADPAAELPVLALALDADLVALGPSGERVLPARDFFVTYLTTALAPDELLVEARFPALAPTTGAAFTELSRRPGDFAIVAAAVVLDGAGGLVRRARIALGAVADRAIRSEAAEAALVDQPATAATFDAAARAAADRLDPPSDVHGSGAYRKHLARVLVRRALTQAWDRAAAAAH